MRKQQHKKSQSWKQNDLKEWAGASSDDEYNRKNTDELVERMSRQVKKESENSKENQVYNVVGRNVITSLSTGKFSKPNDAHNGMALVSLQKPSLS